MEQFIKLMGMSPVNQINYSNEGCAIASFTMIATYYKVNTDYTTVSNKYSTNDVLRFEQASNAYGLDYTRKDVGTNNYTAENVLQDAKYLVDLGKPSIIKMDGYTSKGKHSTHFVVVIGYKNDGTKDSQFIVVDPWGGVQKKLDQAVIYKNRGHIKSFRGFTKNK